MRVPLLLVLFAFACDDKSLPVDDTATPADDSSVETPVDDDGDSYTADEDCDDGDAAVNPGATELCDGVDNDCDGQADVGAADAGTWYADGDGDGYGVDSVQACEAPEGYAADGGDCDDGRADIHPGAAETDCADPTDYNCDGSVGYNDGDGDGVPACEDCNDADNATFPGATEVCNDNDDNCDGTVDEGVTTTFWQDFDGDGHGDADYSVEECTQPNGYAAVGDDCDDTAVAVFPGATEVCNGIDDDCDALVDDADDSLDAGSSATWYADTDGDGYGDANASTLSCDAPSGYSADATDCDDGAADVNSAATELCDAIDNNCDGTVDEDSAADADTWYLDADNDGYGDAGSTQNACARPSGYRGNDNDCDDGDGAVNPGATEVCNSIDDDCDNLIDDDDGSLDASTGGVWYTDGDGDGYGDANALVMACLQPSGAVTDLSDCDDGDFAVNPAATELCNAIDDDCDNSIDDPADLLGSGEACGAVNCNEILATRTSAPDGEYWVDFNSAPMQVFCDMTTSGGGWTVLHPDNFGTLGSLDAMRDDFDRAMTYLRDYNGNRYYTELEELPAFASAYNVDVADTSTLATRITFIPRPDANVVGQTQGFRSNGQDLTFTNCDGNGNSYIEFWQTGQTYTFNQDYTMSILWRNSKLSTGVAVPDDYFAVTVIHQGGCGTHSASSYWVNYDNMRDAALAVR